MWGSSAGGTDQAPHCPYRHGTARGAAPTSVDADCCPHAVGANGAVASSPRGAWGGTAAHAANRCFLAITLPSCLWTSAGIRIEKGVSGATLRWALLQSRIVVPWF